MGVYRFSVHIGFPRNPELECLCKLIFDEGLAHHNGRKVLDAENVEAWERMLESERTEKWLTSTELQRPSTASDSDLQDFVRVVIMLRVAYERTHDRTGKHGYATALGFGDLTPEEAKQCWGALDQEYPRIEPMQPGKDKLAYILFAHTLAWLEVLTEFAVPLGVFKKRSDLPTKAEDHAKIFGGGLERVLKIRFGLYSSDQKKEWISDLQLLRHQIRIFIAFCTHHGAHVTKFWRAIGCAPRPWDDPVLRKCLQEYSIQEGEKLHAAALAAVGASGGAAAAPSTTAGESPSKKPKH